MNTKYTNLIIWGIITLLIGIFLKLNILTLNFVKSISVLETICAIIFEGIIAFGSGLIVAFFSTRIKISDKINEMLSRLGKEKIIEQLLISGNRLTDYKQKRVKEIMSLDEEYRTNTVYIANAYLKGDKVEVETTMSYTVYFPNKKREPIKMRFDTESSSVLSIKITNPQDSNDSITIQGNQIKPSTNSAHGDGLIYEWSYNIPPKFKNFNSLIIEKNYIMTGEDHWLNYGVVFQHLTNGLNFTLNLGDNLQIKESSMFEKPNVFTKDEKKRLVTIKSSQWLSRYGGFSLLITKR